MGLRNWLRGKFLDTELGVVGERIEVMQVKIETLEMEFSTLQDRYDRMANRVQMRIARSARKGETFSPEDQRILDELKAGQSYQGEPEERW